jgi:hypothetical protein
MIFLKTFPGLLAVFYSISAWGDSSCPIKSELNPELKTLTYEKVKELLPEHGDPQQVSGVTVTNFQSFEPWEVVPCEQEYCLKPKEITLTHEIHVRPENLNKDSKGLKPNPRWVPIANFPCGEEPDQNFVTFSCTVDHEKVHVVQREEAILAACPRFLREIKQIRAPSREEARKAAQAEYSKLARRVSEADTELVPYLIEWQCNERMAKESGVTCQREPDWAEFDFLRGLKKISKVESEFHFLEEDELRYQAKIMGKSVRLQSLQTVENCQKKEWYFENGKLRQENCIQADESIKRTFFEYGQKQRVVHSSKDGKELSENWLINPRARIEADKE